MRVLSILILSISTAYSAVHFEVKVGERISDWCQRLEKQMILTCKEIKSLENSAFAGFESFLPKKGAANRFEGQFRPGFYQLYVYDAKAIVTKLLEKTKRFYQELPKYHGKLPLKIYQRSILASIVEKEAAHNKDYDLVATVFQNRLIKNDRLGSCPTVEYALGYHRPFLTRSDISINSPYNVYKRRGLPPTPISFFSDEAMDGVHNPALTGEETRYYFFVYDWTRKELTFAIDYADHKVNANVARSNYIELYGRENLYKKYYGLFYQDVH
jgi:UPF0755 protein